MMPVLEQEETRVPPPVPQEVLDAIERIRRVEEKDPFVWPEKLSKLGEWMKANPRGNIVIYDWEAVL